MSAQGRIRRGRLTRRVGCSLLAATTLASVALAGSPAAADDARPDDRGSLPHVASGPRPGPDVLYAPAAEAPQLQNAGPWRADPILVSGAQAYRDGEWLYQDFLYDDHGATGVGDPQAPYGPEKHTYSPTGGTFTYPRNEVYAHNAADLVELRVKPQRAATALRVTLNTLKDPDRTAFTIALGSGADHQWPYEAGVHSPADVFLTWHERQATLVDAATGQPVGPAPSASLDLERRQVGLRVPHDAWNPGTGRTRVSVGVGLWDTEADRYLAPQPGSASATTPGGGTPAGVALVNVGPRFDEPLPIFAGATMADMAAGAAAVAPWWRERQQSLQLTQGDVTPFAATVDFGKLAARADDESGVPTSGPMNRILASRHAFGQGLDTSQDCFELTNGTEDANEACKGRFVGQLQPYSLYVPEGPDPEGGYGLTLLLHSLSANYNQYSASRNQSQLAHRGKGSLVLTPAGRGPDGFYAGYAEADTFEAWADVARHYDVDPHWAAVSGYSMGGFGTFRMLARWPDLFTRGFSVVGIPGSARDQLASLWNTPVMSWNAAADELVNVADQREMVADLTAAQVRFAQWTFAGADHLTLAGNDEYGPGADFLGTDPVDRSPSRVKFVVEPREDNAGAGVVSDHAYWLSDLAVRDPAAAPRGTVDVRSEGQGAGEPAVLPVEYGAGALTGGQNQAMPYTSETRQWAQGPSAPPTLSADRLVIRAVNIGHLAIDPERAGVSCQAVLDVTTDGPLTVTLEGCGRTERFGARG